MISNTFFSSTISCQSLFCISSRNQSLRASMDCRLICEHKQGRWNNITNKCLRRSSPGSDTRCYCKENSGGKSKVVLPAFLHSCWANPAEGHFASETRPHYRPSPDEGSGPIRCWKFKLEPQGPGEHSWLPLLPQATLAETYLTDENVCSFKVSSVHFGRFTRNRFYFDTDFLSFFCNIHLFMIYFDACYYSNVDKLNDKNRNYNVSTGSLAITGAQLSTAEQKLAKGPVFKPWLHDSPWL